MNAKHTQIIEQARAAWLVVLPRGINDDLATGLSSVLPVCSCGELASAIDALVLEHATEVDRANFDIRRAELRGFAEGIRQRNQTVLDEERKRAT